MLLVPLEAFEDVPQGGNEFEMHATAKSVEETGADMCKNLRTYEVVCTVQGIGSSWQK